jgi:hypothetical protein
MPGKKPERVIGAKHKFSKKMMIGIYGNQRLRLKRLFRGRFLVDSMRAGISDWQKRVDSFMCFMYPDSIRQLIG